MLWKIKAMKMLLPFVLFLALLCVSCDCDRIVSTNVSRSRWTVSLPQGWRDTTPDQYSGIMVAKHDSSMGLAVERLPGDEAKHLALLKSKLVQPEPSSSVTVASITTFGGFVGNGYKYVEKRDTGIILYVEDIIFYPDIDARSWYITARIECPIDDKVAYAEYEAVINSLIK